MQAVILSDGGWMYPNSVNLSFRHSPVAFLTQHGKEQIVAPVLEPFLGTTVVRADGFDTDTLGTFTREIKRPDTQLETARKKARLAMELTGAKIGLGSEGSFDRDPVCGFIPWNIEMLVLIDLKHDLEITGIAEGPVSLLDCVCLSIDAALDRAAGAGFPEQGVILRPDSAENPFFQKNIQTPEHFRMAAQLCLQRSTEGKIHVESDLRANACPARREMIRLAAVNLLLKMHSRCPSCDSPGYWVSAIKTGLPCSSCRFPTGVLKAQVYSCLKCGYVKEIARIDTTAADPGMCSLCNP